MKPLYINKVYKFTSLQVTCNYIYVLFLLLYIIIFLFSGKVYKLPVTPVNRVNLYTYA